MPCHRSEKQAKEAYAFLRTYPGYSSLARGVDKSHSVRVSGRDASIIQVPISVVGCMLQARAAYGGLRAPFSTSACFTHALNARV